MKKKALLLLLLLFLPLRATHYLSILAIFRDEAPWLKEWIEFHRLVGVEHFYLINHLSSDNYLEVLEPYLQEGVVTLTDHIDPPAMPNGKITHFCYLQQFNYLTQIRALAEETTWLAIIDLDEFIVPIATDDLPSLLTEFEEYPGVQLNWLLFGTSGIKKIPPNRTLLETLIWRAPNAYEGHRTCKSIVRPQEVASCPSAHRCFYRNHNLAVDTNHTAQLINSTPALCRSQSVLLDKAVIHHYWHRDEDFLWNHKAKRREQFADDVYYSDERFRTLNAICSKQRDERALRFVPRLRQKLGL